MDKYFEDLKENTEEELFHDLQGIPKAEWYKTIEMDDDEVEI